MFQGLNIPSESISRGFRPSLFRVRALYVVKYTQTERSVRCSSCWRRSPLLVFVGGGAVVQVEG